MALRAVCLGLVAAALLPAGSALADPGPALSVDASAGRHAISPLIYGWNFADPAFAAQIGLPVDRRGGNSADTLNWMTGFENHSNDWFFEDLPWCWESGQTCDAGVDPAHAYTDQINADRTVGAKTILDLPMTGYVAADGGHFDHPFLCSYDTAAYPGQAAVDASQPNCGNGKAGDGTFITNADRSAVTGIAESASYQGNWITSLVGRYGTAAAGGVAFYELGNEPGLWNSTHHDWHPAPLGATELWNRSLALAQQVHLKDPTAKVIGPAEWGWPNYFCSAADGGCGPGGPGGADYAAHGPLMEWYLQKFRAEEIANGSRLLDYLDIHYYAQGGSTPDITRSLWDPTYRDPSWIDDYIQLIPRMRKWVADNYPGTKTSLSEYDLASGGDTTTNNLIEADVLGIFGREQLDMATLWPEVPNANYQDAFRVFRNYDGASSRFGDTYVSSSSGDQGRLAVYGAQRTSDGALTVVVINKSGADLASPLDIAGFTLGATAQVWRWAGAGAGIARQADQAVCPGGFSATYPARSITMIAVPSGGSGSCPAGSAPPVITTTTDQGPLTPALGPAGAPAPAAAGTTAALAVRCVVPKLARLSLRRAKAKLVKAHCRLGKVSRVRSTRRAGTVVGQKPRAGRTLARGARVAVLLSRGR